MSRERPSAPHHRKETSDAHEDRRWACPGHRLVGSARPDRMRFGRRRRRLRRRRRRPETADIRVWLNGPDTPQAARDWLKTDVRGRPPRLHAHHRGAGVGGPRRAAHHRSVQRGRDPRRRRGRQHPGADVHHGRRLQRPHRRGRRARRRRPAARASSRPAVDGDDVRRALLRGLEVRLLPQGPLRGGRPRGADHDWTSSSTRRSRSRRTTPTRRTSPATGSRARTGATRVGVHLGRRRRLGGRGRRRVAGRAVLARVARGPGDRPDPHDRGVRCRQGRQRGRPGRCRSATTRSA